MLNVSIKAPVGSVAYMLEEQKMRQQDMRNKHVYRRPITSKTLLKNKEKFSIAQLAKDRERNYKLFDSERFGEIVRKAAQRQSKDDAKVKPDRLLCHAS